MKSKENRFRLCVIICMTGLVLHFSVVGVAHAQGTTKTIALSGEQAGGTGAGVVFDRFGIPSLNDSGQTAYTGNLATGSGGVTTNSDQGIWRDLTLVVREGSQAGGTASGVRFESLSDPSLNNAGQTAYRGVLRPNATVFTTNNQGIWRDSTLVARTGSQAGGLASGAVFSAFGNIQLNDMGQTAYSGSLRMGSGGVDATNDSGIWHDSTLIARAGSQAGGTSSGILYSRFSDLKLNNAGQTAYSGTLQTGTGGVDGSNNQGIWLDSTLIAREGSQAVGTPSGAVFSLLGAPMLNDVGQTGFLGYLKEGTGGVDSTNNQGIWLDSTLVARTGSQAGGTPYGAEFRAFYAFNFEGPKLNDAGQIAYMGLLRTGTGGVNVNNDSGIWRDSTLVVREGTQAAGTTSGSVFERFHGDSLQFNDGGQIAYVGDLRLGTGDVVTNNDRGIWLSGTNGESLLVARAGDSLAGKTINFTTLSSDALNNFSQVGYRAKFTDGEEGIFLYTPEIHYTRSASSNWDTASNWTIGQRPGDPHDVFIDPTASLTVSGPTADVSMTNLTIGGNNGIATLALNGGTIHSANAVTITSTGVLTGDGVIAGDVTNNGVVSADNVTITGMLTNNNRVNGSGRINANFRNADGARLRVLSGDTMQMTGSAFDNRGLVEISNGELEVSAIVQNAPDTGLISVRNGSLLANSGIDNDGAIAMTLGASTIQGDVYNSGVIQVSGGAHATFFDDVTQNGMLQVSSIGSTSSTAVFLGEFSGSGGFTGGGDVFALGDLRPGNSPDSVLMDGNLFLGSTTNSLFELAGMEAGEFDQILVTGDLSIDGELFVDLIDGHSLALGNEYLIAMVDGTLTGQFDGLGDGALVGSFGGHDLFIGYSRGDGNDIGLFTAVPEPGAFALLSLISVATVLRRRRT